MTEETEVEGGSVMRLVRRLRRWWLVRNNGHEHELTLNGIDGFVFLSKSDGQRITVSGWNNKHFSYRAGHRILLIQRNGRSARYKITRVDHCSDPPDMYFFDAVFLPRYKAHNS